MELFNDVSVVIDVLTLIVLVSMVFSTYQSSPNRSGFVEAFLGMLWCALVQTVINMVYLIANHKLLWWLVYITGPLDYCAGYCITLCFCIFLFRFCADEDGDSWLWRDVIVFAGLGFLVQAVAVFVLTWQNQLFGPAAANALSNSSRISVLYLFTLTVLGLNAVVVVTRTMPVGKKIILCLYCLMPLVALPMMMAGIQRSQGFVLVQTVLIYCHIFAVQGKDLAETEAELTNSRMETMLSQIQPHFLYNALSSCVSLCDEDPQLAKQTLLDFSKYLRANLDSLGKKEPIPFTRELEHTRTYLHIEQIRFGEKVKVEYDLQETDFLLPALTLQPLAENAVKHGITMKRGGGTVKISTRADDDNYYVVVEDDGVGFEKLPEGREHIGVRNIQGRLASMVGGSLTYNSQINIGTKAVITLPRKGK